MTQVREEEADVVASHAGVGIGLATCLRSAPFRLLQGEIPLSADLFPPDFPFDRLVQSVVVDATSEHSNDHEQDPRFLLSEEDAHALEEAVRTMAREASSHLMRARDWQGCVPKAGRPCLLPVVPSLHYLRQLEEKCQYDVLDKRLRNPKSSSRLSMLLSLGRTWLTGIF